MLLASLFAFAAATATAACPVCTCPCICPVTRRLHEPVCVRVCVCVGLSLRTCCGLLVCHLRCALTCLHACSHCSVDVKGLLRLLCACVAVVSVLPLIRQLSLASTDPTLHTGAALLCTRGRTQAGMPPSSVCACSIAHLCVSTVIQSYNHAITCCHTYI